MSAELGPLHAPSAWRWNNSYWTLYESIPCKLLDLQDAEPLFTADQMAAEVAKERERCAKLVDVSDGTDPSDVIGGHEVYQLLRELAEMIRNPE